MVLLVHAKHGRTPGTEHLEHRNTKRDCHTPYIHKHETVSVVVVIAMSRSAFAPLVIIAACADGPRIDSAVAPVTSSVLPPVSGPTTIDTPVGLALDIEDGVAVPFRVRKNQRFYINQIDLRAHIERSVDEGVAGLDA